MTELARWRPQDVAVRPARDVVDGWAERWSAVLELVPYIADSDFVPVAMRGNRAQVAACILAGREIGLGPMTALQHINVIEGRPGLSAHMQRALAQAAGAEIVYDEMSSGRCVVRGRRSPEHQWTTVTWDLGMAQQMGIAGKANWRKMPRQMLIARATGELCRLIAADALAGMAYNLEELADVGAEQPPEPPRRQTVRRGKTETPPAGAVAPIPVGGPAAAPPAPPDTGSLSDSSPASMGVPLPGEPGYDELLTPENPPENIPENIPADVTPQREDRTANWAPTEPQIKKLFAMLGDIGIRDRQVGHAFLSVATGRPIDSSKELTRGEMSGIIDFLTVAESSDAMSGVLADILTAEDPVGQMHRLGQIVNREPEQ